MLENVENPLRIYGDYFPFVLCVFEINCGTELRKNYLSEVDEPWNDDDYMFYSAIRLLVEGEYDILNFPIDEDLDIVEETLFVLLYQYDFLWEEASSIDTETYFMICYAILQAERGEFSETAICPFSGLEVDNCFDWYLSLLEITISFFWYEGGNWDYNDINAFCYSLYLQTEDNPDESFLVDSKHICQNYNRAYYVEDYLSEWNSVLEPVNHYNWHPIGECYKISQEFNSNLGQAIQYIYRSGGPVTKHEDVTEDLRKAIQFLEFEIERLNN